MEPFTLIALSTLSLKLTSVVKYLSARDWTSSLTQIVAWAAGVLVVCVAAQADLTAALEPIPGHALGDMDFWSQVLVGMGLASLGSTVYDVKSAIDGGDSAKEPSLGVFKDAA